ncbi:ABC-type lipoprotein release transport system permease subunit [Agromyces hippuratus]|uniref:ABC-type lipoprotein release transport system permease subunit n=1 Tax=Agromyces hippuratus TaxID=286438 RepID=A0A852WXC9_9MICO|nr:ABC transporter permease [Agromyces hippuratus]NYG22287.1 ABC-type lipoprotein release transport system permease subunit [Agromyces hippuratus]
MFFTYLRRELAGRRRQTAIIAIGMALAIALVMIVNSVSTGVRDAQASVLESVYGVGTDLTVSQTPTPPAEGEAGGPRFEFDADAGTTADGSTEISQSRLSAGFGSSTFDEAALASVEALDGVATASATLSLTNTTFDGELPDFAQTAEGTEQMPADGEQPAAPPQGGFDGAGGSAFDVDSFTVLGLDPASAAVGPLSAVELADGRGLEASDTGEPVAVLDASYATSAELAVGDTIDVGGTEFEVVGTVSSTSADAATAANVYIPLDLAQSISGEEGMISSISVQAESADGIDALQAEIEEALPDATVSTQSDLAASVSGSLASASSLISNLGLWVSLAVLVAAFLIAILFTIQGVTRRTREFGTLKAIGWSNGRIVGQVTGESLVQGLIGGGAGLMLGLAGIWAVNLIAPTIGGGSGSEVVAGGPGGREMVMQAGGPGGGFGGAMPSAASSAEVVLQAPVTVGVIAIAIGLSIAGGLVAGAFGGWRAAKLRPAEALRSVA